MKILIVSEPGVNGVFRYVEALCDYLLSQGVELHFAYSDVRGSDRLPLLVNRVTAAGGATLNLRVDSRPTLRDFRALFQLWKLVRRVRPDVIHSHSSKAGGLARLLPLLGIRTSQYYQPHAYRGLQPDAGPFVSIFNLAESLLGRTGRTVNISTDEQAFAVNRLGIARERTLLVPNGIDCRRFHSATPEGKRSLRQKFGLPPGAAVLGTVCRSSNQKDPLTLYRAFDLALKTCPNLFLLHIGEGELDGEIETLIDELGVRSRVVRLPYLQNTVEAYQAVDGFILTCRYEGFSLAALEAIASNLPIVISEAPGTTDLLQLPLSHLWKARPGDVPGFAQAIAGWYQAFENPRPINHETIASEYYDCLKVFRCIHELYKGGHSIDAHPALSLTTTQPAGIFASNRGFWWSRFLLAIGYVGVAAAVILTLKNSGNIPSAALLPSWLVDWINHHGELRNFFAYAILAAPFLFRIEHSRGRRRAVWLLSLFAIGIECAQLFVPTRTFDLVDIIMSLAGIGSTWGILEAIDRSRSIVPATSAKPKSMVGIE